MAGPAVSIADAGLSGVISTSRVPNANGLGEPWDVKRPYFRGHHLPDPRIKPRNIEIATPEGEEDNITGFFDVNIIDSTGKDAYRGDVLVKGQRIDQINLSMSGEEKIREHLRAEDKTIPDDIVVAAGETAHENGIQLCSHARSDESIVQCSQYCIDIVYHASFISDETMYALEKQKERVLWRQHSTGSSGHCMTPLLSASDPTTKAESVGYSRELEVACAGLKEMHRRGIKILPGNDYGFAWTPTGTYRDLELFVKYLGITPMKAILSAMTLGREIMLHPEELGKVQPGYYADVILVDGNPLEDICHDRELKLG